jgi:hypothetical protein
MEVEFSREIFKKYSNIKFQENPSSGNRVVPCGRKEGKCIGTIPSITQLIVDVVIKNIYIYILITKISPWKEGRKEGRTDMKILIVAFRNFANVPKNRTQAVYRPGDDP